MPSFERTRDPACIRNPVGGDLIGNAVWKGAISPRYTQGQAPEGVVDVIATPPTATAIASR